MAADALATLCRQTISNHGIDDITNDGMSCTTIICSTGVNVEYIITLKMEYFERTRSMPWLLMPWLLVSPGHQQPWYWWHYKWWDVMYHNRMWYRCECEVYHDTKNGIFWENWVNTMAADALATLCCQAISNHGIDYVGYMSSCLPQGRASTKCTGLLRKIIWKMQVYNYVCSENVGTYIRSLVWIGILL